MAWPDRISVYHKLRFLPTSSTDSFILDVVIMSERHQRPAARCVEYVCSETFLLLISPRFKPPDMFQEYIELSSCIKKTRQGTRFYCPISNADSGHIHRDIVVYDYRRGKKTPLRAFMLEKFQETWEAQEEAKGRNESRVRRLLERVEKLEKESWDRQGAVEDFGGH